MNKMECDIGKSVTRRGFLKKGSMAAAVMGVSQMLPSAGGQVIAGRRNSGKIRMGIAGGRFGLQFQWHEHPDCVVEAVTDLIPERRNALMKTYECSRSYPSLEEMVKDRSIDAIGIFTPAPDHVKHVKLAMEHGKHVISAVPAACCSMEEAYELLEVVERTGLTYMMAETSYYQQFVISARKFYEDGKFGNVFHCESFYQHDGLEPLFYNADGSRTWRYGYPPMLYPTHCTAHLVGVTGERLVEVSCHGWGDDSPILKDNAYNNPFWNNTAMFKTDRGNSFYCKVWWKGAHMGNERAEWIGDKMSFYGPSRTYSSPPVIVTRTEVNDKDDAGFVRSKTQPQSYEQVEWFMTDRLPEPLRHTSGHHGSHTFLTHEFISALKEDRAPKVDIYEALSYTVPGIIAHESALNNGKSLKVPVFRRPV
jgi:predicted dehydrogenase